MTLHFIKLYVCSLPFVASFAAQLNCNKIVVFKFLEFCLFNSNSLNNCELDFFFFTSCFFTFA